MATEGNRAKNARRKAERRIAELGRQFYAATTEQSREKIQQQINDIKTAIAETRMYGANGKKIAGRTLEDRKAAIDRLEDINKEIEIPRYSSTRRSNDVFRRNVNIVSSGGETDVMTETDMRAFWRATQKAWEGKGSRKDRFKQIQEYYGTNDLQLIFDIVMQENADNINLISKVENNERLTGEEKRMLQDLMRKDDDLEKKYLENENSPLVGMIASNIPHMSRAEFWEAVQYYEESYFD